MDLKLRTVRSALACSYSKLWFYTNYFVCMICCIMCLCTPLFNLSFQKYYGSFHKMVISNGKNIITNHRNDYDRGLNAPFFLWQLAPGRVSRGELVLSERPDIVFTFKKEHIWDSSTST